MIILSHRGYWKDTSEKNKKIAFERSFDMGFGTETDIRDVCGTVVVSHDMPRGNELTFEDLLKIMDGRNLPLALNIKADGLCNTVKELLLRYNHTAYFCFDMSIPDMVYEIAEGMKVFTGLSDILPVPVLVDKVDGIWLDSFYSDWYTPEKIDALLQTGKRVCIVSSDLHQRNESSQWNLIKQVQNVDSDMLYLCTDHPEKARNYFL